MMTYDSKVESHRSSKHSVPRTSFLAVEFCYHFLRSKSIEISLKYVLEQ